MRLIDETEYQERLAKTPMEERTFRKAVEIAEDMPTIEAEPVRHGRWIEQEAPNMDIYYDCSACGEPFCFIDGSPTDNLYTYCPNGGAKMDKENP